MNAPRYIVKNAFQDFQRELDLRSHQKRLNAIRSKRIPSVGDGLNISSVQTTVGISGGLSQSPTPIPPQISQMHKMHFIKQQVEKLTEINKKNEILLERLVDINRGKSKKKYDLEEISVITKVKKAEASLNYRKNLDKRIHDENTQIVQRLVGRIQRDEKERQQSRKRAVSEYLEQRQHLSKLKSYQAQPCSQIRLPPIDQLLQEGSEMRKASYRLSRGSKENKREISHTRTPELMRLSQYKKSVCLNEKKQKTEPLNTSQDDLHGKSQQIEEIIGYSPQISPREKHNKNVILSNQQLSPSASQKVFRDRKQIVAGSSPKLSAISPFKLQGENQQRENEVKQGNNKNNNGKNEYLFYEREYDDQDKVNN